MHTSVSISSAFSLRDCIHLVRSFLLLLAREKRAIIKLQHERIASYTAQKKVFLEQLSRMELTSTLVSSKNTSDKILFKQLLSELKQSLHVNHELLLFALECVQTKQQRKSTLDKGICGYNRLAEPMVSRNNGIIRQV